MCSWVPSPRFLWAKVALIPKNLSGVTIRFGNFLDDVPYFIGVGHVFSPLGGPKRLMFGPLAHFVVCQGVYVLPSRYRANVVLYPFVDVQICPLL